MAGISADKFPVRVLRGPGAMHGVNDFEDWERHHHAVCTKKKLIRGLVVGIPPVAYVNDGRWICDCLCGSGAAVDVARKVAMCYGCGAVYRDVVCPDEDTLVELEIVMAPRPESARNWNHRGQRAESLAELDAENTSRNLPSRAQVKEAIRQEREIKERVMDQQESIIHSPIAGQQRIPLPNPGPRR